PSAWNSSPPSVAPSGVIAAHARSSRPKAMTLRTAGAPRTGSSSSSITPRPSSGHSVSSRHWLANAVEMSLRRSTSGPAVGVIVAAKGASVQHPPSARDDVHRLSDAVGLAVDLHNGFAPDVDGRTAVGALDDHV